MEYVSSLAMPVDAGNVDDAQNSSGTLWYAVSAPCGKDHVMDAVLLADRVRNLDKWSVLCKSPLAALT